MKCGQILSVAGVLTLLSFGLTSAAPQKPFSANATQFIDDFPWETFCIDYNVPEGTVSALYRLVFKISLHKPRVTQY
jgi:hypothetical protein